MKSRTVSQFAYVAAVAATIAFSILSADAQTVTQDAQGNYTAKPRPEVAHTDSITGLTYTDLKGKIWPVYVGAKGSRYVARVSGKSGKYYRQYLKKD